MQNGNMQIKDLFNGDRIFNIPKYQRTYSWEKEQLENFLDDLKNQRDLEKNYFLGTFLFHRKNDKNSYEYIDVVDGQQRLTTIIIFLSLIIKLLEKNKSELINNRTYKKYVHDDECFKLELENEDNSFLHNIVLNNVDKLEHESPSQKKLFLAKEYFKKRLENNSLDFLEKIYTVLTEANVIIYVVDEIADATQIFELLNDRGKKLTSLEGVKSFLMHKISCLDLSNKDQQIDIIQDNFASIYRIIEKYNINESDVLRYHTIAFEECKTEDYNTPDKYIKNKINSLFENKKDDFFIKNTILEYVEKLKNSFKLYKNIKINNFKSKALNELYMIGRVNPYIPLIMNIYEKETPERIERFIDSICKFTFRATLIGLRNDNEGFYSYIRKNEYFLDIFKKIIDENWWDINRRVDTALNSSNHYKWANKNIIKYILFSYENYLRLKKAYPLLTKDDYSSEDTRMKLSIEHITAQRSQNLNISESFKEEFMHHIGNLVIDTAASNSRKGNKDGDEKEIEFSSSSILSQLEIGKLNSDWKHIKPIKDFIENRGNNLRIFIENNLL